jgi:hypothetical protein
MLALFEDLVQVLIAICLQAIHRKQAVHPAARFGPVFRK